MRENFGHASSCSKPRPAPLKEPSGRRPRDWRLGTGEDWRPGLADWRPGLADWRPGLADQQDGTKTRDTPLVPRGHGGGYLAAAPFENATPAEFVIWQLYIWQRHGLNLAHVRNLKLGIFIFGIGRLRPLATHTRILC